MTSVAPSTRPGRFLALRGGLPVVLPLAFLVVLLILPSFGLNVFWQAQVVLMVTYILVVCGVNLTFGYAGELALGQVAVFATGAYVSGYLSLHGFNDLVVDILAAAVAGAAVGLLTGLPGLRIGGWALGMASFFLVILLPDVVQLIPSVTGGTQGLSGLPLPKAFGHELDLAGLYVAALVVLLVWIAIFRNFVVSRHGIALKVLRQSPELAASVGTSVYRLKLTAYVVGSIPAAVAGVIYSANIGFVGAATFSFSLAIGVIAGSIIGGADSVYGAVVGGALLEYLSYRTAAFAEYSAVVYGVILVVGGVLVGGGLAQLARKSLARVIPPLSVRALTAAPAEPAAQHDDDAASPAAEQGAGGLSEATLRTVSHEAGDRRTLHLRGITKRFGGVAALQDVSIEARPGEITAVIGPNGSGKTTLLNVASGVYRPDAGSMSIGDEELPQGRAHRSARAGVSRTFQTPIIPAGLSAWEAVAAARYRAPYCAIWRSVLRTPRARRLEREDRRLALAVLDDLGLDIAPDELATSLPLGHRRMLEVGRALIRHSSVILLDEVASGLDEGDIDRLKQLLRALRETGASIVLVEHNFPLVLELADTIYVLDVGRVIATGTPEEIQHHPDVVRSYLGEGLPVTEPSRPILTGPESR